MTLTEFKAWFEGFTEAMEGPPSADQWKRIKARVAEVNGTVTSYPVFIDRYVTPYKRYYENPILCGATHQRSSAKMLGPFMSSGSTPAEDYSLAASEANMQAAGGAEYKASIS